MLVLHRALERKTHFPAANTLATVTYAAVAGKKHHAVYIGWSYNAAPTGGKLTIKDGASVIHEVDITAAGPGAVDLPPVIGSVNTAMVVELAAGGASATGKLNAYAYTET